MAIEAIDEPRDREKAQEPSLLDEEAFRQTAHRDDFRNTLIWGDNKLVVQALLEQFRGKIDLIYIDPPFDVSADFTMKVQLGEEGDPVQKEQSILEAVAARELGSERREPVRSLSTARAGDLKGVAPSTRGPE